MFKRISFFCLCCCFLLPAIAAGASPQQPVRLGVMPFLTKTGEVSENQAAQVTDSVTRILHVSPSISIIERERLRVIAAEQGLNTASDNQNSAMKIAQLAGCQYILLGSVTQLTQRYFSSKKASGFLFFNFYGDESEMQESTAKLEARLIDVNTGRVVLSFSQEGSAVIATKDKKSHFKDDLTTRAINAASSRLGDKIREVLADEYAMIITANKKNVRINRGSASGVDGGALYRVYEEGEELFDLDGKSLGKKSRNIAIVRVVDVRGEYSTVEVFEDPAVKQVESKKAKEVKKSGKTGKAGKTVKKEEPNVTVLVREGDRIEAITRTEADALIKKGNFLSKRS